jgi:hypothetical protein
MLTDFLVYNTIIHWTQRKNPFCISRFGDGEGLFAFLNWNYTDNYNKACLKHWGEVPKPKDRQLISDNILYAYTHCDIAGLPFNSGGKLWNKTHQAFMNYFTPELTCSMNIHINMERNGFLKNLLNGQKVFYISCRNVDTYLKKTGATEVKKILISPQHKFEKVKPDTKLYKQIPSIEHELSALDLTGWICLLGAGIAGNHLGIIMRSQGGMVIDIGSVFDLWAGINSRGWIKKFKR